LNH
ncbi:hypothetical protein D039_4795, partial [Vibrio parahaemolyticus EKP-028]|jgi:hypothetical protein